jgi:hypothetical protein
MKQEIIILQQQLIETKATNDNEKSYNKFFIFNFLFFLVFGLEVVNHPHPEKFSLCRNILSFKNNVFNTTIYLKPTITSIY